MEFIKKIIAALTPFRDLILIVTAIAGAAYGAITHFATADQLASAKADLEELQASQHNLTLGALEELRCINSHNRELLRAEMAEFRLSTLLQENITNTERLRESEDDSVRVILVTLSESRDTLKNQIRMAVDKKNEVLAALRDGACSPPAA